MTPTAAAKNSDILKQVEAYWCLRKANLSIKYAEYYFDLSIRQAANLAQTGCVDDWDHGIGRPKIKCDKPLTWDERLLVVELFYYGYDLLSIQRVSGLDINKIHFFLFMDDTWYGYDVCPCGQQYVFLGSSRKLLRANKCASCQSKKSSEIDAKDVSYRLPKQPLNKTDETRKYFNSQILPIMRDKIVQMCALHKLGNEFLQRGKTFLQEMQSQGDRYCVSSSAFYQMFAGYAKGLQPIAGKLSDVMSLHGVQIQKTTSERDKERPGRRVPAAGRGAVGRSLHA